MIETKQNTSSDTPVVIDLYCGRGGVGRALAQLGWQHIGIDTEDYEDEYPGEFTQANAANISLDIDADLVWASPPCQAYSKMSKSAYENPRDEYPTIPELNVREVCRQLGAEYIIENVVTCEDLRDPVKLNGKAFGLPFHQERWFETSFDAPHHRATSHSRDRAPIPIGGCRNRTDQANRKQRLAIAKRVPVDWPESAIISAIPDHYVRYLLHWCPSVPDVPLPAGARAKYNLTNTRQSDTQLTDFTAEQ